MALQMFPNLTGLVFEQLVIKTNDCNDVNIWFKSPGEGWSLILGRYPDTFWLHFEKYPIQLKKMYIFTPPIRTYLHR